MFTSRAEYRLLLRHGNADLRLTQIGRDMGLIDDDLYTRFHRKQEQIASEVERLGQVRPSINEEVKRRLIASQIKDATGPCTVAQLLRRQNVSYEILLDSLDLERIYDKENIEEIEIQIKYEGYIKRQLQQVGRFKKFEEKPIPAGFSYDKISGFSREVRDKLNKVRPASVGQASRISGVTPAAISLLLVSLEKSNLHPTVPI
ncbi:hypothetical protein W02_26250 [Nitrospira sp. KM1]|nr:hypothetical protein W02_26250 [Nitrospira sp. KM1]